MTELPASRAGLAAWPSDARGEVARRLAAGDAFLRRLGRSAAAILLLIFAAALVFLIKGSTPAIQAFGLPFFTTAAWNPVAQTFGAGAAVYGTVATAAIAMLIVGPVGVGMSVFLTEFCPRNLRRPLGVVVELAAATPSVIYGIWGLFVLPPFMGRYVEPGLIALFGRVPVLKELFAGPPHGFSVLTAGFLLAIMALPFVAATMRDALNVTPAPLKEAAYAIGCTRREVVGKFVIPFARLAVLGAILLGLGRALGEAIAVAFVIGNAHVIPASLLEPGTTIAATILNEFPEAVGDLWTSSLMALGLALFAISFVVLVLARLMFLPLERKAGR